MSENFFKVVKYSPKGSTTIIGFDKVKAHIKSNNINCYISCYTTLHTHFMIKYDKKFPKYAFFPARQINVSKISPLKKESNQYLGIKV